MNTPFGDALNSPPVQVARWRLILGGLPDLATAAACLLSWLFPTVLGVAWVKILLITVLAEFIVIHSGGFMSGLGQLPATRMKRLGAQLGLILFYLLFIWALASSLDAPWLYVAFGWLFISKLVVAWSATPGAQLALREQMIDWPFAVAAYLLSTMLGFLVFDGLRGGISPQVFLDAGLADAGLYEDKPWVGLSAGTFYFSAMALWRFRLWRWRAATRRSPPPPH